MRKTHYKAVERRIVAIVLIIGGTLTALLSYYIERMELHNGWHDVIISTAIANLPMILTWLWFLIWHDGYEWILMSGNLQIRRHGKDIAVVPVHEIIKVDWAMNRIVTKRGTFPIMLAHPERREFIESLRIEHELPAYAVPDSVSDN